MSYDFYGRIDTGGHEPYYLEPSFSDTHPAFSEDVADKGYGRCGNYTSNVSGMWRRCLTAALDEVPEARKWCAAGAKAFNASGRTVSLRQPDGTWLHDQPMPEHPDDLCLRDLDGARMGDIAPVLHAAVEWGVEHINELREMNPSNGWGDAEGAVTYLWDIARFCDMHPNATLGISS